LKGGEEKIFEKIFEMTIFKKFNFKRRLVCLKKN